MKSLLIMTVAAALSGCAGEWVSEDAAKAAKFEGCYCKAEKCSRMEAASGKAAVEAAYAGTYGRTEIQPVKR